MERVWRKVNEGLTLRSSGRNQKKQEQQAAATLQSNTNTGTNSSAAFQEPQSVAAVSHQQHQKHESSAGACGGTYGNTGSSERKRRRRRRSRPRREGTSSSHASGNQHNTSHHAPRNRVGHIGGSSNDGITHNLPPTAPPTSTSDQSLRQRAVARLKMFNFNLNWDLHMTQCKPCGPKSGNILTRRLCRNRRRDDNELYRSNSFKFERFERKDCPDSVNFDSLRRQISVCDDYSLPIDFVKKRPSSFDPCLSDRFPENWASQSPQSEHVTFADLDLPITSTKVKILEGYYYPKDSKHLQTNKEKDQIPSADHSTPIKQSDIFKNTSHYHPSFDQPQTSTEKDITHPCTSDSSVPRSSEDERDDDKSNPIPELNSPDSISEDLIRPLPPIHRSPKRFGNQDTGKRNPSPYYYSDLLKKKEEELTNKNKTAGRVTIQKPIPKYRKSSSLDTPGAEKEVALPKRYSITEEGVRIIRCDSPSTTTSDDSDCSECRKRRDWHAQALALVRASCNIEPDTSMPPRRFLGPAVCACAAPGFDNDNDELFRPRSIFYVHQQGMEECADCTLNENFINPLILGDEMNSSRTRQIYETAFDSKVGRSDDDLDEVERITNHPVMISLSSSNDRLLSSSETKDSPRDRHKSKRSKNSKNHQQQKQQLKQLQLQQTVPESVNVKSLADELQNLNLQDNLENIVNASTATTVTVTVTTTTTTSSSQLPLRGYTPSPPSTAPLPMKFPVGKHERFFMNSIKSAPNLPSSNPVIQNPRLQNLRLDIKTIRQQEVPGSSDGSLPNSSFNSPKNLKERPRSMVLEAGRVLELKRSHHHHSSKQGRGGRNFSSIESFATSSSGGSMESIRSSASEGNRSTSSSETRNSSSLSSHSSDSGPSLAYPLRAPVALHTKLHILSPISDKSQEPGSETSDAINKQNNSHKLSPEDVVVVKEESETLKQKRRPLPNKTLLLVAGEEIQGSDSGISLHSREDAKSRLEINQKLSLTKPGNLQKDENSSVCLPQDLNDLPFDMPKLRRRRATQQDAITSGSATSVDLGELPFDMPKLRRRLRMNQQQSGTVPARSNTESSGLSQASSSQSIIDDKHIIAGTMFRQNLTLNFNEIKPTKKFGTLDLQSIQQTKALNLPFDINKTSVVDLIDASIPLERQGWYHGAIGRIEAETTLRPLNEGSFLVRNSESTRQDYSLSLKSAKGFMHMRIQRNNETGQYILGQFSRPFDNIPEMIRHFCLNRLPVRGAEHMCLLEPVIAQLL